MAFPCHRLRAQARRLRSLRRALTSIMNSVSRTGANTGCGGGWLSLASVLSCQLGEYLAGGVVEGVQCADHLLLRDGQCPSSTAEHLCEAGPGGARGRQAQMGGWDEDRTAW